MERRIENLRNQLDSINSEIQRLSEFRDTPFTRKFRRQLGGEKSVILAKITKLNQSQEEKQAEKSQRQNHANRMRSQKMKRTWRYLRSIQQNYPIKMTLKELRTALRKHRQGLETDVSDIAWKNPSP